MRRVSFTFKVQAVFILAVMMLASGCRRQPAQPPAAEPVEISDITDEARAWADSVTAGMTVREQAAQLLMPAMYSRNDQATINKLKWYVEELRVGGILLLKGDAYSCSILVDSIDAFGSTIKNFPGVFVAIDAETGLAMRFADAPKFPWNNNIKKEATEQDFFDYGREIGRECRIAGINMILGPVVDVDHGLFGGVMKKRSLGKDQHRVAELSESYSKGVESQSVLSVAKHFPGHGATGLDTHKTLAGLKGSREELDSVDLAPFKYYSANGLSAIMVGHLWASALDSIKRPASFSPVIIKDLLRDSLNFEGLVIVDAVVMGGASGYKGVDAVKAGADIIIAPYDTEEALNSIMEAVDQGEISREELAAHCRRVLFYKYIFDIPFSKRKESGIPNEQVSEFLFMEADSVLNRL